MSRTLTSSTSSGITLTNAGTANNPFTVSATGAITPATGDALIAVGKSTYNWTIDNFGTITSTPSSTHGIYLGPGTVIGSGTIINEAGGRIASGGYGIVINGKGSVTNKAGGTIAATNFKAIYLIDTGTVTNAGVITAGNVAVYAANGGVITNQSGGTISGNGGVWFNAPGTFSNAGVVIGTNAGFGAILFNATSAPNRFINVPGATVTGNIIAQPGGTDIIELTSAASTGTLSGFGTSITNFDTLVFDSGAQWKVSGNSAGLGGLVIQGFAQGNTIDVTGFNAVSATFASNALVLTNAASAHATLRIQGTFATSNFQLASDGSGGTNLIVCFGAGTRIATPGGATAVEDLAIGDIVSAHFAGDVPIRWIGRRDVDCTRHPDPRSAWPVRVCAGAFGAGQPASDLFLSPNHAVFVEDVLIPVGRLINGTSIMQVPMDRITYFHLELAQHDLLQANGLLTESYLDVGDRANFSNADGPTRLIPTFATSLPGIGAMWEAAGCAPLIVHGPKLESVRASVAARAGSQSDLPPSEVLVGIAS